MKIEIFSLCDAATEQHGKLNMLGTFDTVWSKKIPVVIPQCSVALRMRFSKLEEGEHILKINIIDEDGQPVIKPFEAKVNMQAGEKEVASMARNMILNLHGIKFEKFGEHAVDLAIDGRHEASLPFFLNQVPEKGAEEQPGAE